MVDSDGVGEHPGDGQGACTQGLCQATPFRLVRSTRHRTQRMQDSSLHSPGEGEQHNAGSQVVLATYLAQVKFQGSVSPVHLPSPARALLAARACPAQFAVSCHLAM